MSDETTTTEQDRADDSQRVRQRTRRRVTRSPRETTDAAATGDRDAAGEDAPADADERRQPTGTDAKVVRRRRRRPRTEEATATDDEDAVSAPAPRAGRSTPQAGAETGPDEPAGTAEAGQAATDEVQADTGRPAARRKDGGGRRKQAGGTDEQGDGKAAGTQQTSTKADEAGQDKTADKAQDGQPTRLQSKSRSRGRGRGRSRRGRKPTSAVSEETRRTIAESPPRRMLVQVGEERTQVAVLEQRTLVEHFVTRKADVSYVGNIYLGRVQNVLPGMEAAFVDIGKGRNGVLYAGEVNYDEADLDGELPRIEETLKPGQSVLVQVTKDPMGTKGARLTQHLSVAGRYCVLAPGDGMLGISRKLSDDERERLRKLLKELKPEGFGLIVRTAAEDVTREQLEADVARLTRIWTQVQEKAKTVKPLEPVYEEPNLVMRVIRDVFGTEYTDLVIDDAELAEQVRDYLSDVAPDMVDKVSVYDGDDSLFDAYEVTTQVRRALEKKVWLKSGGYLIIEKTEAMWVIDVNTGKFVGQDNLEETVLRNNLEAAEEIARQLRLRDMGGIIVIDFVDMLVPANRDEVLKRFKRELARDKTKSRVMDISRLGLVQMTRKNVSHGVFENFTARCETCEGRGARILDEAFR